MFNATNDTIAEAMQRFDFNALMSHPVIGDMIASSGCRRELFSDPDFLAMMEEDVIIRYADYINWHDDDILSRIKVPERLLAERPDLFNWHKVAKYQHINEECFRRNFDIIDLRDVSSLTINTYSPEFVMTHYREFEIAMLLQHVTLPESFYENISEYLDEKVGDVSGWDSLAMHRPLSEEFIERHLDKFTLGYMITRQKLSLEFIRKYRNKFDSRYVVAAIVNTYRIYKGYVKDHDLKNPSNYVTRGELNDRLSDLEKYVDGEDDCDEDEHANWYETDEDSAAYIGNRPTIPSCDDCCDGKTCACKKSDCE